MQSLKLFMLFQIVAISQASKPRSVNLALETVLEFDNNDDIKFIDTMQSYLDKIKRTIARSRAGFRQINTELKEPRQSDGKELKFSEFLANTLSVLKSYSDETLKRFFVVLNKELTQWNRNKSLDGSGKLGSRRIIITELEDFKDSPADDIRRKLDALSKKLNYNKRNQESGPVADFLNYFYTRESQTKLARFLNNLKLYRTRPRRSMDIDLNKIIQNGIKLIVEPILKLTSNATVDKVHEKKVADKSDYQQTVIKKLKNKMKKSSEILHEHIVAQKDMNGKEILDYIEDHNRVVHNHMSTIRYDTQEESTELNNQRSSAIIHKLLKTTRRHRHSKVKPKHSTLREVIKEKRRKKKNQQKTGTAGSKIKHDNAKIKKYEKEEAYDKEPNTYLSEAQLSLASVLSQPFESSSKSDDHYLPKTTKQRRYKKFTRRPSTTKRYWHPRTTKQGRKAFKTTVASVYGLSIEHFGNLYNTKFNRKSNDNDTFTQAVINTTLSHETKVNLSDVTTATTKETTRDNFKEQTISVDKGYSANMRSERKMEEVNDGELGGDNNVIAENIKLTGDIFFETPVEVVQTTKTTIGVTNAKIQSSNKYTRLTGTTLTTQNLNKAELKPTLVFRHQDRNETYITTYKASTGIPITTKTKIAEPATKKDGEKTDTTKIDYLENEIDNIINKFNKSSTITEDLHDVLKKSGNDGDKDNNKVQNQMKADFENLLAPSTTKITAQTFTESFEDIDEDDEEDDFFK